MILPIGGDIPNPFSYPKHGFEGIADFQLIYLQLKSKLAQQPKKRGSSVFLG